MNGLKKFFGNKPSHKIEKKFPQDVEMAVEMEEEEKFDVDMKEAEVVEIDMDMEMNEKEDTEQSEDELSQEEKDKATLEDAKAKRAERRKVILKELEVCDLLDLRNP